jgi:hypothetical protein
VQQLLILSCCCCCDVLCDVVTAGVLGAGSIVVSIEPPHVVTVLVPDRYHLQLTLPVPISSHAESVRFQRRTGKLAMLCTVASTTEGPAAEQDDATAAKTTQPAAAAAAGSMQELECADAACSGTDRCQQQQHAGQAATAQPSGQGQAKGQPHSAGAAQAAETRCGEQAMQGKGTAWCTLWM